MTNTAPGQAPDYIQVKRELDGASVDYVLQDMVDLANKIETFSMGLTLHVGGGIVTGRLIGGRRYFEEMAATFLGKDGSRNVLYDWMMSYQKLYPLPGNGPEDSGDPEAGRHPPLYIHLSDAHFVTPGSAPIPNNHGVLWRGTINSVSGWSLGVLAATEGEDESSAGA